MHNYCMGLYENLAKQLLFLMAVNSGFRNIFIAANIRPLFTSIVLEMTPIHHHHHHHRNNTKEKSPKLEVN